MSSRRQNRRRRNRVVSSFSISSSIRIPSSRCSLSSYTCRCVCSPPRRWWCAAVGVLHDDCSSTSHHHHRVGVGRRHHVMRRSFFTKNFFRSFCVVFSPRFDRKRLMRKKMYDESFKNNRNTTETQQILLSFFLCLIYSRSVWSHNVMHHHFLHSQLYQAHIH